jgi:DNA topoisomerase-1
MGRIHRVTDEGEGIRRVRAGRGFSYRATDGLTDHGVVRDPVILARIRALAIPPAWTDVWICPSPDGHVQATGRDAKGRKQYRYHANWRAARERQKFDTLAGFGVALPAIRRRRARDLARGDLSLATVTAGVVLLLERTMIRVGNEEYVRANGSFGLTTLRSHHARVSGDRVDLRFVGKGGIAHDVTVNDVHVAELVQRCRSLDGDHLFQYLNGDGRAHAIQSTDVNDYLRHAANADITAKDFRTWMATLMAGTALATMPPPESATQARREVNAVIDHVASRLRNTRAVCRASYVHPAIVTTFNDGTLAERWQPPTGTRPRGLKAEEQLLLGFLRSLGSNVAELSRAA